VKGLPDYHVHTFRCGHAGGASRDFVLRAVERGLGEIGFTDHIPLYFLTPEARDPRLAMREDQLDGYLDEVAALRHEFRDRIPVRLGLEADYAEGHEDELAPWLERAEWDLVLGSVHWVAGDWIDSPETANARFAREGVERLYAEYYRLLARAGGERPLRRLDPLRPAEEARTRPGAIPRRGGRRGDPVRQTHRLCGRDSLRRDSESRSARPIPKRDFSAASSTPESQSPFSSDAHAPAEVGWGYEKTLALARSCGVTEYVTFERRRKIPHPLPG
jgi:histidinol-phosphatase (PHP family)